MVYSKYVGNYGSLNPSNAESYGEITTGYEISAGRIGSTTSSQTANQVSEVMQRLNEGTKTIELAMVSPQILEQVPQEQFREINRIAKLSGLVPTAHAPIVDPAGFGGGEEGQGASWSEATRLNAEKSLLDSAKRLLDANPEGNMNITFHASSMPAIEWQAVTEGGKEKVIPIMQHVVRVDDGRVFPVRREEMFKPQEGMEMRPSSPDEVIKKYNKEIWDEGMMKLIDSKRVADRELGSGIKSYMNELKEMEKDKELSKERKEMLRQQYEDQISGTVMEANHYYRRIQDGIESMYNQLQKDLVNRKRMIREIDDPIERERTKKDIENMNKALESISVQWKKSAPELKKLDEERRASGLSGERKKEIDYKTFEENKKLVDNVIPQLDEMRMISPQKLFVPIEKFAKDKAAETFSNIAFQINQECEKTGRKAPIISIENVFPNMAFSRADQLRELIDESREKFVMKAVDSGMSKEKAWDTAEKLIGATWDVAHLNLIRKEGRSAEGSVEEMERQTKLIAPYVKKVHIVDNFGFSDSHIPLGMGNVPKEKLMNIMKENEFAGPMISEAVAFAQQFKMSPHVFELEALGAPLNYPGFGGPSMSESRSLYGSSFTGYGNFLPEQHFAMYGGGFSGLPLELGGRVAGGKSSQFSGTPME